MLSFNPIKVLFYQVFSRTDKTCPFTFNPIKVLFYHRMDRGRCWYLQLSILSRFYFIKAGPLGGKKQKSTFNPIKVLFYLSYEDEKDFYLNLSILSRFYFIKSNAQLQFPFVAFFQSYQGSILSKKEGKVMSKRKELSILSRFYFIGSSNTSNTESPSFFQSYQGSILSLGHSSVFTTSIYFQSYQGSILSAKWTAEAMLQLTFNPIKVLFYRSRLGMGWLQTFSFQSYQGSILSRFSNHVICYIFFQWVLKKKLT